MIRFLEIEIIPFETILFKQGEPGIFFNIFFL